MGTVYRVHDYELEEVVALKVMNPLQEEGDRMLARFKRETKLARRLVHKNICRIFDFGTDGPLKFVTMELISGHELNALMQKGMIPEFPDKITLFHGVLSGLEEAHREGIIHRDLKPENILIRRGFHPVIMDFGIAREIHMSRLTYTGQIFGTPLYMSPEQFLGHPLDQRTDIYSLGVIVYELFTGETPFQGTTPFTVAMGHLKEPPQSPRVLAGEIPPNLEHIILRMLEKTPQARYPSVRQIKEELELVPTTPPATVLIAEQDQTLRLALTRCLNRLGYHVLQADSGPQALELSLLHLPNLICLNLRIPQMEGLRVAEMLREHPSTQKIPLFLLLGLNDQQYITYGRQLGIRDYFVTPPDLQEFTSRIEQRLNTTSPK
jgi:serine/threonine protein kinase